MIVLIDNYDSFVFNVARYLEELGRETLVVRNDAIDPAALRELAPEALVLSPGPCAPLQAGISLAAIDVLSGHVPILGICLGHQCIGQFFGGRVDRAIEPMHGRASEITHDGSILFKDMRLPFHGGRYHSLIVNLPAAYDGPLRPTAWAPSGEIMALTHETHPTYGVQFHPESVLTEDGHRLLGNFLALADEWWRDVVD